MKKSLLFLLAAGLWTFASAQNAAPKSSNAQCVSLRPYFLNQQQHQTEPASAYSQNSNTQSDAGDRGSHQTQSSVIHVGSAFNAYGVLDASTTAVTANQALNVILMTHRRNFTQGGCVGTGAYEPSYSTDGGNTWDSAIGLSLFCGDSVRYPNGVIFNPAGNTNLNNAYEVVGGPLTNEAPAPADSWVEYALGSIRFDGTNPTQKVDTNGKSGAAVQNTGNLSYMTSCDDSTVHLIGDGYNVAANGSFTTYLGSVLTTGKFNGTGFTWTQKVFRPHFWDSYLGATSGSKYDSLAEHIGSPATAWSQDGKTGYVVILGNLDSAGLNYVSYQPVVYKTTDHGTTWTMMPPFNFRTLPSLTKYLTPTADSAPVALPLINVLGAAQGNENDYDVTVDKNGDLHIFASVQSMFYANPDSAYRIYTFKNAVYYIYDIHTVGASWNARFIDSLHLKPGLNINTSVWIYTPGPPVTSVSYGARIQASRTTDGSHVYCTWEDDVTPGDTAITYPDVFTEGYNVSTSKATSVFQVTTTSDQYFLCVSDIALTNGSSPTYYTIPCVYVGTPNGNNGTKPVEFLYQGGVRYTDDTMYLAVNEVSKPAGFSVSDNYPNPFTKATQFNITLEKESNVAVDVFNMVGQKVWSMDQSRMTSGIHTVSISGSTLNAGVYFYRVTVNDNTVTHKMVVE